MRCSDFVIGSEGVVVVTPGGTFESNCVIPQSVFPEQTFVVQSGDADPSQPAQPCSRRPAPSISAAGSCLHENVGDSLCRAAASSTATDTGLAILGTK